MNVSISRLDPTIPLPQYQTPGAVAFDLAARADTVIEPGKLAFVPTGLVIATPPGFALILASRSSTPYKKGLMVANGIGVVDQDYCGPRDELRILVYNFTKVSVTVRRGERIAQGFFIPLERVSWDERVPRAVHNRGGFGSTG